MNPRRELHPPRPRLRLRLRLPSTSLFWTFTGAFLLVLLLGAILQAALVYGVIRPVTRHWLAREADTTARAGAEALGRALEADSTAAVDSVLAKITNGTGPVTLFYRDGSGWIAGVDRPIPRARRELRGGRRWGRTPAGERPSAQEAPDEPSGEPPRAGRWRDDTTRGPVRGSIDGPRRPPGEGPAGRIPAGLAGPLARPAARAPVLVRGRPAGEILALVPPVQLGAWPSGVPRPNLLFIPVAAVVAGAAGLLLFRALGRRLRRIEAHAEMVAAGDFESRIADPGRDELGRLGLSLNRMSDRLAAARRSLEEADRQRRQLLADVTHELSTPLTTIRGYTETLLDPGVPVSSEEEETYLRDILEEARRMDLLVADLLDLARLEAGVGEEVREAVDWRALAHHSIRRFEPLFRDAGLTLAGPPDPGPEGPATPVPVLGNPRRLEQLLDNLLRNALRYVPRGKGVTVRVERRDGRAILTVEDDGPGFAASDLPRIFDRFYRGDRARTSEGTGLGLALVREIARLHGGSASAENRPEGGARLRVDLPALPGGEPEEVEPEEVEPPV